MIIILKEREETIKGQIGLGDGLKIYFNLDLKMVLLF